MLGVLRVANDGIRNEGAWIILDQLFDFMFFQHTYSSLCLTSDAAKGSLKETCPVSLLELD